MENLNVCQDCQSQQVKWYCSNHQLRICMKCALKNHQQCTIQEPSMAQDQKTCQKCKQRPREIYCKDHQLYLCDSCFFLEHKNCKGTVVEDLTTIKDDFIKKLKETKIKDFQISKQTKTEELSKSIDKIIKQLQIIKDLISENNRVTESFTEKQLQELDITIGKISVRSINELYLDKCYNEWKYLTNQTIDGVNKINIDVTRIIDLINQYRQSKFNEQEFKKDVILNDEIEQQDVMNLERQDCKYILPTNSNQVCNHTIIYNKQSKELFTVGRNSEGELGIGNNTDQNKPIKITSQFTNQKIQQISCGYEHSLILTDKGVWSFGYNSHGQLGNGNTTNSYTPINISNQFQGEKVKLISCGIQHTAVLTHNNKLFTFGYNSNGQLGDNSTSNRSTPIDITNNILKNQLNNNQNQQQSEQEMILNVSVGWYHTMVLTNKSIYGFGKNAEGQLGIGDQQAGNQLLPIKLDNYFEQGSVFKQIKAGEYHSIVLTNKGLFTFGRNTEGQLGNNSTVNSFSPVNITNSFNNEKIVSINCGQYYTIIQTESNLYSFGNNTYSELGDGSTQNKLIPTKIAAQLKDAKIKQIECLGVHSFIETNKGLFGFGYNSYGGLGIGSKTNQSTPILLDEFYK